MRVLAEAWERAGTACGEPSIPSRPIPSRTQADERDVSRAAQGRDPAVPMTQNPGQRLLTSFYEGSTVIHRKGAVPRIVPAVGDPKPRTLRTFCCQYCKRTFSHAPAVAL